MAGAKQLVAPVGLVMRSALTLMHAGTALVFVIRGLELAAEARKVLGDLGAM